MPSDYGYNSGIAEDEPTPLDEELPPPAYSDTYGQISNESALGTNASIAGMFSSSCSTENSSALFTYSHLMPSRRWPSQYPH